MKLYYVSFILGIIAADINTHCNIDKLLGRKILNYASLATALLGLYIYEYLAPILNNFLHLDPNKVQYQLSIFWNILSAFLFILGCAYSGFLRRILNYPCIQYLGRISFSVYLLHLIVLSSYSSFVFIEVFQITQRYKLSLAISFITSLPIIIVISHLFERYIVKKSAYYISQIYNKIFG